MTMMAPGWVMDIFAAIMLVVAAISAVRLVPGSPWRESAHDADMDISHLLMGISMAGMLTPVLQTLPDTAWEVVFGVLTVWFGWHVAGEARRQGTRVLADGHHLPHLVHSAAMVYMFAAPAAGMPMGKEAGTSGMSMGALRLPGLALVFALWLAAYVVLDLDRLSGPGGHPHGSYFARMASVPAEARLSAAGGVAPMTYGMSDVVSTDRLAGHVGASHAAAGHAARDRAVGNGGVPGARRVSQQLAAICRIAMGVTMAFMLVIMI